MDSVKLFHGDCLDVLPTFSGKIKFDAIIADLPYGKTACKWDEVIPFSAMWERLRGLSGDHTPVILFGQEPFSSRLRMSNLSQYRHEWYWDKNNSAGFATCKIRPFSIIENIIVFSRKKANYYPVMVVRGKPRNKGGYSKSDNYAFTSTKSKVKSNTYYPKNLINIGNASQHGKTHSTQKPVALLEYLIKTYTIEGDTILDFTMGVGTTGVAAVNLNRNFVGVEKEKVYFDVAKERLTNGKKRK